jgi:hypothetical protein
MPREIAFWAALGAYALLAVLLPAGGATYPGYSQAADYISALGARIAPYGQMVSYLGFLPIGLGIMTFAAIAARLEPRSVLRVLGFAGLFCVGLSYAVAAFFQCDRDCRVVTSFEQAVHTYTAVVCYLAGVAGLFLVAIAARTWPGARHLFPLGLVCGVIALVAMFMSADANAGLWQRLLEGAFAVWIIACAFALRRGTGEAR